MIRHRPLIFNLKVNKGEMDLVIKFNECGSYSKAECMDGEEAEKVSSIFWDLRLGRFCGKYMS